MKNDDDKQTFTYEWHHIPTGKTGTNKLRVYTKKEFLDALDKWNQSNPKVWTYVEKSYDIAVQPV